MGIEGLELNFSPKNNKVHNKRLSTLHPNGQGTLKKDILLQKKKRRTHQEVGGAIS